MNLKKLWKNTNKELDIMIPLFLIIISIYIYFAGLHAVDLCRNELDIAYQVNEILEEKFNTTILIYEQDGQGRKYSVNNLECHTLGMKELHIGYTIILFLLIYITFKKGVGIFK